MGEDSTAFGGAIRDMWTPTCMDDPGKVTDAEYHCLTTDGGGVHTNSGVPNHGYALLVDGGTYNGQTVAGIGLVKAAHHLLASAERLPAPDEQLRRPRRRARGFVRRPDRINRSTASAPTPAGRSVQPDDRRGGLRRGDRHDRGGRASDRPGAQCNFQPLLNQNTPTGCADRRSPRSLPGGLRGRARRLDAHEQGSLRRMARHELGRRTSRCQAAARARRPRRDPPCRATATAEPVTSPASCGSRAPTIHVPNSANLSPRSDVRALRRNGSRLGRRQPEDQRQWWRLHGRTRLGVHVQPATATLNTAAPGTPTRSPANPASRAPTAARSTAAGVSRRST